MGDRPGAPGLRPHAMAAIEAWLACFDEAVRPVALARQFPRIADRLALLDSTPDVAVRYVEKLMIDDRGDRDGFPVEVARELMRLRMHYGDRAGERADQSAGCDWTRGAPGLRLR